MKIKNAKIKNVTTGLDSDKIVCVNMVLHYQNHSDIFVFNLEKPVELNNLKMLLELTNTTNFKDLEGKTVRVAQYEHCLIGIGDPIKNRFVDVGNTMIKGVKLMTEAGLFAKYSY